jgi:hypothetical protein
MGARDPVPDFIVEPEVVERAAYIPIRGILVAGLTIAML